MGTPASCSIFRVLSKVILLKVSMPEAISTIALRPSIADMRSAVSVMASKRLDSDHAAIFRRSRPSRTFILSVVKSVRISGLMSKATTAQ